MTLRSALDLAQTDNPTIGLARETVSEALAGQTAAEALKLPSLNAGANVRVHRGVLQQANGNILDIDSESLYYGAGAGAVGTSTVAFPGVRLTWPLADVIYEPQAARDRVLSQSASARATDRDIGLEVALAVLELRQADELVRLLRESETQFGRIVEKTTLYVKAGQGRDADRNRAITNLQLLEAQTREAIGERETVAARLSGLLGLDPSTPPTIQPDANPPAWLTEPIPTTDLPVERAFAQRPEMVSSLAQISEARVRLQQERMRPFLPTLSAAYSYGSFGGGSNLTRSGLRDFDGRSDFDVVAVWNIRNAGVGESAIRQGTAARLAVQIQELDRTRNRIREEVQTARADLLAAASRIETARVRLTTARAGYEEENKRIESGEGRPLEVLDSTRSLLEAKQELLRATTDEVQARYRLRYAVGLSLEE